MFVYFTSPENNKYYVNFDLFGFVNDTDLMMIGRFFCKITG